jgi:hypothetical protein
MELRLISLLLLLVAPAARAELPVPPAAKAELASEWTTHWPAVLPCQHFERVEIESDAQERFEWSGGGRTLRLGKGVLRITIPASLDRLRRTAGRSGWFTLTAHCPGSTWAGRRQGVHWGCRSEGTCDVSVMYARTQEPAARTCASCEPVRALWREEGEIPGGRRAGVEKMVRQLLDEARALADSGCVGGRCTGPGDALTRASAMLAAAREATNWREERLNIRRDPRAIELLFEEPAPILEWSGGWTVGDGKRVDAFCSQDHWRGQVTARGTCVLRYHEAERELLMFRRSCCTRNGMDLVLEPAAGAISDRPGDGYVHIEGPLVRLRP